MFLAVLVNDTLFVLFGQNQNFKSISSIVILDVSDPSRISYLDTYVSSSSDPRLSKGATIGIAIGASVGVSIIDTTFNWQCKLTDDTGSDHYKCLHFFS